MHTHTHNTPAHASSQLTAHNTQPTDRHTRRQTDRHTGRQTGRQADRQTGSEPWPKRGAQLALILFYILAISKPDLMANHMLEPAKQIKGM